MGRGDNRRTLKSRQRKSWRKFKEKTAQKILAAKSGEAKKKIEAPKKKPVAAPRATVTRKNAPTT